MKTSQNDICNKLECTFTQTGQCVLNNEPLICPDRLASLVELQPNEADLMGEAILTPPEEMERFSSSLSLSLQDVETIMGKRYCKLIGILGVPASGKTAGLVSLYLLLSHNKLEKFRFLDSKSIMAFEEISRGTRPWSTTEPPEQLTVHTELQDERIAGFLHLRVMCNSKKKMDLLFADLPGEWTSTLIDKNRLDRWDFLRSTDRIWITVNGEDISNAASRQYTIHRLKLLFERLITFLGNDMKDISLIVTHSDKTTSVKQYLSRLLDLGVGFSIEIFEIASFSDNDHFPPGTGISGLILDLVESRKSTPKDFWPQNSVDGPNRNMLLYRNM